MKTEYIDENFGSIMIIVPHQDDELLMSAGIVKKAVSQKLNIVVVMVTNGDYESTDYSIGRMRLKETLEGMEYLGLCSEQVIFLGYADTGMVKEESFLWKLYQEEDKDKILESHCSKETYGLEDKTDFHTACYKTPGTYCRRNFYGDLKRVIQEIQPENIFTTSECDIHGDHSGLYLFVKDVLEELKDEVEYEPQLYSGMVHSMEGDDKWPLRAEQIETFTCPKGFEEASGLKWEERISFPVPKEMKIEDRKQNMKYQALSKHRTALKPDAVDYLYSFVKSEEIFWKIKN